MNIEVDVTHPRIHPTVWNNLVINSDSEFLVWMISDNHFIDGNYFNFNKDLGDVVAVAHPIAYNGVGHYMKVNMTILDSPRGRELLDLIKTKTIDEKLLSSILVQRAFDDDFMLLSIPLPYANYVEVEQ